MRPSLSAPDIEQRGQPFYGIQLLHRIMVAKGMAGNLDDRSFLFSSEIEHKARKACIQASALLTLTTYVRTGDLLVVLVTVVSA